VKRFPPTLNSSDLGHRVLSCCSEFRLLLRPKVFVPPSRFPNRKRTFCSNSRQTHARAADKIRRVVPAASTVQVLSTVSNVGVGGAFEEADRHFRRDSHADLPPRGPPKPTTSIARSYTCIMLEKVIGDARDLSRYERRYVGTAGKGKSTERWSPPPPPPPSSRLLLFGVRFHRGLAGGRLCRPRLRLLRRIPSLLSSREIYEQVSPPGAFPGMPASVAVHAERKGHS